MTTALTAAAAYLVWAAVSVATVVCSYAACTLWLDKRRDRNAARARDQRRHPSSQPDHGAATVRAMQVYAAVPELRGMPVEDAGPLAATVAEIHALPTYRGGQR